MSRIIVPDKIRSILVLRLGGIGDMVMATPAIKSLRKHFTKARLTVLAEEPAAEVIRGAPYVDELLTFRNLYTYRRKSIFTLPLNPKPILEELDLARLLFFRRFNLFVDLHLIYGYKNAIRPMLTGYLSRAPIRAGLDTDGYGFFLNLRVPDSAFQPRQITYRSLDVAAALGADVSDKQTEVWITDQDREFSRQLLRDNIGADNRLRVGLHIGANPWVLMRQSWPLERFARVADALAQKYNTHIIVTGNKSEQPLADRLAGLMQNKPFMAVGRTTLKQAAALMGQCHLFISSDTGPMHMAVAMKTPTVGIFGPGNWPALGTYAPETNFTMVRRDIDCWPCHKLDCASRACMEKVTVEDVLDAAEKQIAKIYGNRFSVKQA
jgi:heptosyltransferase-2